MPPPSKETETLGASPSEQLLETARRNNTDLLQELLSKYQDKPQEAIELINSAKDSSGNGALHLAAKYGNYEVMDHLLDIDGVDVNIKATMNGNTPLHYAVLYSFQDPEYSLFLVNELINCGADPSIRNNDNLKPIDLIGNSNDQIKEALESAEYAAAFDQNDIVDIPEDDDLDEGSDEDDDDEEE
ncbi:hypothetical protein C6P40_001552 [Pichia californica]|uniref:Ankyrin repeat-containing protein n=1 Tax=Pichia californica TaxID=460514 RepID=A0A9P6WL22_9ASCO|nr:hypothetical protein C6P42_001507 [[Candida] californica]KAG0687988.1 hypothetical protein C6P40_001552 [[Candida] californica]